MAIYIGIVSRKKLSARAFRPNHTTLAGKTKLFTIHFSFFTYPSGRPEGACAFCRPQAKNKEDLSLYGIEMILNSDGNGTVKLFYTKKTPEEAEYSDIYVAEVDSRTGHVERFSKADYAEDGLTPFELVKYGNAFDAATLPVDSEKAISAAAQAFSNNQDFHYDYVQVELSMTGALEQYEIRFISMLNDRTYLCMVDAVNGAVLESSSGALVQESDL